jgi:cardiolipin synthase
VLNIPNTITLLRIVAVPFFLSLLVEGSYRAALVVFLAAGISDGIDGAIARLTNARTELGAHLDPLADKL